MPKFKSAYRFMPDYSQEMIDSTWREAPSLADFFIEHHKDFPALPISKVWELKEDGTKVKVFPVKIRKEQK